MARAEIKQEQIFYDDIATLIKNLLIDNPNYKGNTYYNGKMDFYGLLNDTKERAKYIIERMDQEKHLIGLDD